MKNIPESNESYGSLNEKGIDIRNCFLDLQEISIRCNDLSRYRKALRVKIRALLKREAYSQLRLYINALYHLGLFSKYIYGFHSCNTDVTLWQEALALSLQKEWDKEAVKAYDGSEWINYDSSVIEPFIYAKASENMQDMNEDLVQDGKPFLNPKDQSHFDKVLFHLKEEHA